MSLGLNVVSSIQLSVETDYTILVTKLENSICCKLEWNIILLVFVFTHDNGLPENS